MGISEVKIRIIYPKDTYPIRQQILRPGRPLEEIKFSGDTDVSTIHLGAFMNDSLIGIASLVHNHHKNFDYKEQYQLRGMAVLPEAQKKHVGQQLLQKAESILKKERQVDLLWCNARESAVDFYRKNNYYTHGKYFEIPNVCTHIVMYKVL